MRFNEPMTQGRAVSVLVADANRLVTDALVKALRQYPSLRVLDDIAMSGQEVVSAVARLKPEVILLDLWIPGMDASSATRMIVSQSPGCKVLILSWLFSAEQAKQSLAAGAAGFLPKSLLVDDVVDAIKRASAGEVPVYEKRLDEALTTIAERRYQDDQVWDRLALLTPREIQILKLMDEGLLVEHVAKDLSIKTSTVRNHIHNILEKTGTQTHVQALAMARRHGLIRQ